MLVKEKNNYYGNYDCEYSGFRFSKRFKSISQVEFIINEN